MKNTITLDRCWGELRATVTLSYNFQPEYTPTDRGAIRRAVVEDVKVEEIETCESERSGHWFETPLERPGERWKMRQIIQGLIDEDHEELPEKIADYESACV